MHVTVNDVNFVTKMRFLLIIMLSDKKESNIRAPVLLNL